jgi:hypothetical protein
LKSWRDISHQGPWPPRPAALVLPRPTACLRPAAGSTATEGGAGAGLGPPEVYRHRAHRQEALAPLRSLHARGRLPSARMSGPRGRRLRSKEPGGLSPDTLEPGPGAGDQTRIGGSQFRRKGGLFDFGSSPRAGRSSLLAILGRDRSRLRPQVSEGLLRAIGLSGYQGALVDPAGLALGVGPIEELGTLWLGRAGDRWVRWAPGEPGGLVGQTDPDSRTFGTPRVRPAGRSPTRREALEGTRGHDKEPCNELTRIVARVVVQFTGKIEPMEQTLRPILPGASQAPSGWQINLSSGKGGPELRSGRTDLGGSR